jgi:hypothetical protein
MIQTYIMRSDVPPIDAVKSGEDASICGGCVHRGDGTGKGRSCYVTLMHGPRGVYAAYKRGSYPRAVEIADGPYKIHTLFAERMVRLRSRRSVDKRDGVHFVGRLLCELLQQVLV